MSALASMITIFCTSIGSTSPDACNKALDAGTQQMGVRQDADLLESKTVNLGTQQAYAIFTKDGATFLGATAFLVNTVKSGYASVELPNPGFCQELHTEIAPNQYMLKLQWKF